MAPIGRRPKSSAHSPWYRTQSAAGPIAARGNRRKAWLLLASLGRLLGSFSFDNSQRLAIVAPQNIVDDPFPFIVGHSSDGKLTIALLIEGPVRFFQQQVNKLVAGLGFVGVVRVGLFLRLLFGLGNLSAEPFDLFAQLLAVGQNFREFVALLAQLLFHSLQLI